MPCQINYEIYADKRTPSCRFFTWQYTAGSVADFVFLSVCRATGSRDTVLRGKKRFIASRLTSNYKNTMLWWYLNGRVMHYLADSFTKPHQIEFNFSKEDHAEYEARLHTYFTDRIRRENLAAIIPGLTKKQRIAWLNRRYEQYMCEANDIETDYPFIVTAAAFALEWLWEASGEHRPLRFIRPLRQGSVFGPVHGYGIGQTVPVKVKFWK